MFALLIFFLAVFFSTFGWRLWVLTPAKKSPVNNRLANQLKEHVYNLSFEIGERSMFNYENLDKAAGYIESKFSAYGYDVELQHYRPLDKEARNIIAVKKGSLDTADTGGVIIVAAHYDSCFNPGADDNASGVAVLLELAKFLADKKVKNDIRFIAFVNEEPPFFKTERMGSRVYVKGMKRSKENVKAALILESVGYFSDKYFSQKYPPGLGMFYPNRADFIGVIGNFSSRALARKVTSGIAAFTDFGVECFIGFAAIPGVDFSDNWAFWKEGYPAVMVTDTAFYRNSNYHKSSDTYEKLNYERMAQIVEGISAVALYFGNL